MAPALDIGAHPAPWKIVGRGYAPQPRRNSATLLRPRLYSASVINARAHPDDERRRAAATILEPARSAGCTMSKGGPPLRAPLQQPQAAPSTSRCRLDVVTMS